MVDVAGDPLDDRFRIAADEMRAGVAPGANTAEVLAEVGYDTAAIEAMRAAGAVG